MENVRGTQGMTISGTEAFKKIWIVRLQKMVVSKSKHHFLFSTEVCFCSRPLRVFF